MMWKEEDLRMVMKACIILNNMIVEDERDEGLPVNDYDKTFNDTNNEDDPVSYGRYADFLRRFFEIRDKDVHNALQKDLAEHQWSLKGSTSNIL